jgi:hypothetical protein
MDIVNSLTERWNVLGYAPTVAEIAEKLGGRIWLTGGWVRSALLGHSNYVGDIDCLISGEIDSARRKLASLGTLKWHDLQSGGLRIELPDGNNLDLSSTFDRNGDGDVAKRLSAYDASINAVAISLRDGSYVEAPGAMDDAFHRRFRVMATEISPEDHIDLLGNIASLLGYYRLTPREDPRTSSVVEEVRCERMRLQRGSPESNLGDAGRLIKPFLPKGKRAWIVRGFVRCALLGELSLYDDIDVVVEGGAQELLDHLAETGVRYSRTIYGMPKIRTNTGLTLDIWCLNELSMAQALRSFEFRCDSLAWSVSGQFLEDPLHAREDVDARRLIGGNLISGPWPGSPAYLSCKAAYLCLRHDFSAGDSACMALLKAPVEGTGYLLKNVDRLARELSASVEPERLRDRADRVRQAIGVSPAVDRIFDFISTAGQTGGTA